MCRRAPDWAIPVAVAAALGLAGCGGGGEKGGGGSTTAPPQAASRGLQVWNAQGCASCHTLAAAKASGTIGPNLDDVLKGKPKAFIRTSIVSPDAEVAKGFSAGVMPRDFAQKLSDAELRALVDFLATSAGD